MDGRINRRLLMKATVVAAIATPVVTRTALAVAVPELPWPAANEIVRNTKLPSFPDKNFDATAYGAKGDNKTDNTDAFRKANAACNAAGGGHVIVPKGTYVTGAIHLLSNVDFHLEDGVLLKFSSDGSKFPTVLTRYAGIECMNRSPMVYAHKQPNIALTGKGTLDAGATSSWNRTPSSGRSTPRSARTSRSTTCTRTRRPRPTTPTRATRSRATTS